MSANVAVVTGANRGIGLEVSRQLAAEGWTVFLGSRSRASGEQAATALTGDVRALELDVTEPSSVERAAQAVADSVDQVDVLVNNAGILADTGQRARTVDLDLVARILDTNVMGAWRTTQALLPLLVRSEHPRVVNVSSGLGSLAEMRGGLPGYRMSKTALNALTRMLAAELSSDGVLVNSVCPGWVATDMGGSGGRPVADGAASVLWAALLPDDGPSGGFYRDGREIAW
jgi:NAD(P)-dependent dehydrogenase (short-subunit alcohol dehydrogenase family)